MRSVVHRILRERVVYKSNTSRSLADRASIQLLLSQPRSRVGLGMARTMERKMPSRYFRRTVPLRSYTDSTEVSHHASAYLPQTASTAETGKLHHSSMRKLRCLEAPQTRVGARTECPWKRGLDRDRLPGKGIRTPEKEARRT